MSSKVYEIVTEKILAVLEQGNSSLAEALASWHSTQCHNQPPILRHQCHAAKHGRLQ